MQVKEAVERARDAEERLTESCRGAVEDLEPCRITELIEHRHIRPALEHRRTHEADVGLDEWTRKRDADAPEAPGFPRSPLQQADQLHHGGERAPLIVRIDVCFAPFENLADQIDEAR